MRARPYFALTFWLMSCHCNNNRGATLGRTLGPSADPRPAFRVFKFIPTIWRLRREIQHDSVAGGEGQQPSQAMQW